MSRLPTVITTSVVRSSHQGESHGGVYLVDLESGDYKLMVDWNNSDIDWDGRGGDRGLRGIAFCNNQIFIAASDEIMVYDTSFAKCNSLQNHYLKHCHEIFFQSGHLYICSTGYDSILIYSLAENRFILGYCIRADDRNRLNVRTFDPTSGNGPVAGDTVHLNSVFADDSGIHVSGYRLTFLLLIGSTYTRQYGHLPAGTHNARPYGSGTIYNDTASSKISLADLNGNLIQYFPVYQYATAELTKTIYRRIMRARVSAGGYA